VRCDGEWVIVPSQEGLQSAVKGGVMPSRLIRPPTSG
jgi:hypothetical protein